MDTRKIAIEHRLSHWSEVMRERQELGVSIRSYCKTTGISECVYYYWQRRVRASVLHVSVTQGQSKEERYEISQSTPPSGWALCTVTDDD